MPTLERAIEIAVEAHKGQKRWNGEPYILHPFRVMLNPRIITLRERIVAILHDVVEDNPAWTFERLVNEGFSFVKDSIVAITHLPGETYEDYIKRCAQDQIGRKVKLSDLEDNSDPKKPKLKYIWAEVYITQYPNIQPTFNSISSYDFFHYQPYLDHLKNEHLRAKRTAA